MTITFRHGVREAAGVIVGLIGPSGSGKTFSAMRLATGMAQGKLFAVIDTEARRSTHYADRFSFDVADLHAPFRPSTYADAIKAADDGKYPVIVVDSCSHEYAGEGGLLDWQEEELTRMAKDDYQKREACKMASWIKPKMAHKQMVQRLLQIRAHLILCFRAEEKIEMVRGADGKMQIVPKGWQPICEKNLPYELTASFLLTPERPGYGQPIKLQEQHKPFFDLSKPLDETAGERLAKWAEGGSAAVKAKGKRVESPPPETPEPDLPEVPAEEDREDPGEEPEDSGEIMFPEDDTNAARVKHWGQIIGQAPTFALMTQAIRACKEDRGLTPAGIKTLEEQYWRRKKDKQWLTQKEKADAAKQA